MSSFCCCCRYCRSYCRFNRLYSYNTRPYTWVCILFAKHSPLPHATTIMSQRTKYFYALKSSMSQNIIHAFFSLCLVCSVCVCALCALCKWYVPPPSHEWNVQHFSSIKCRNNRQQHKLLSPLKCSRNKQSLLNGGCLIAVI